MLIGEPTYRLVRNSVQVEAVEPLELKGKAAGTEVVSLTVAPRPAEAAAS